MMKKLLLLLFITSFSVSFSQEAYYNNVNKTLTGLALKDELATKIIATTHNCYKCIQLSPTMRI